MKKNKLLLLGLLALAVSFTVLSHNHTFLGKRSHDSFDGTFGFSYGCGDLLLEHTIVFGNAV